MITDFPEAKKEIGKTLNATMRDKVRQSAPFYAHVNKITLHEGDKLGVIHPDKRHVISDVKYVESVFSVSYSEVPTMNPEDFLKKVEGVAEDVAGQMERGLFEAVDESLVTGGNVFKSNNPLSLDSILDGMATMSVDFKDDDRNQPIKPTLFLDNAGFEKVKELEASATPKQKEEHQEREKKILDKKFDEYMQDLNSRKIVD